jgi:choline transporter-like protein 2/4/5
MVENRRCRDVLFLLFFVAYWAGMFVVCGIAFQEGEGCSMANAAPAFH